MGFLKFDIFCILQIRLEDTGFDFPNLVQLELKFVFLNKQWDVVLDLLNHCPKLQHLVIGICQVSLSNIFKYESSYLLFKHKD